MHNGSLLFVVGALALGIRTISAQETFRHAEIDSAGQLRVDVANDRVIRPPKDSAQVSFDQVALSADRRIVGWVALYPNGRTSYPLPLKLILFRIDGSRTAISNGLPIWQWAFAADGHNVVIREAPVHGTTPTLYELRAIRSGRLIAQILTDSTSRSALPTWARAVMPR